ncbi:MAG: hypothetical protein FJ100_12215 [Deltaproteobacteria bacterium]|nr:hypothetical protein [Deltaproteobacteria bacterium]
MRKRIWATLLFAAACETTPSPTPALVEPPSCAGKSGCITTVIGYGVNELPTQEGSVGWKTAMSQPLDMTVGPDAKLYFLDWNNHMLRLWDPKSQQTKTLAGTGEIGDLGAGGPAVKARLNHPTDLAFTADGSILMAAWHNSKIKKLDLATGILTDVCGTGLRNFAGDGGPAAKAVLDLPVALAIDAKGAIYITDQANMRIRVVDTQDKISTWLGDRWVTDTGRKDGVPKTDDKGRYVDCNGTPTADAEKYQLVATVLADGTPGFKRFVDQAGVEVQLAIPLPDKCPGFGGDGGSVAAAAMAMQASQSAIPNGKMAIDRDHEVLYFADTMNHRIRKVDLKTGVVTTWAGNGKAAYGGDGGPALDASFNTPVDLDLMADGSLLVADTFNHCIRKIDAAGKITTFAGTCGSKGGFSGDGGAAHAAKLKRPFGVHVDKKSGRVYIADTQNNRIRVVEP